MANLFESLQDDTRKTFIKEFGELVVVYTHTSKYDIKILMFALKYCTMPQIIDLDANPTISSERFRNNTDEYITPEFMYWKNRVKKYLPQFSRWTHRNNLNALNYTMVEIGVIPPRDNNIKIPQKPTYKLSYSAFVKANIGLVLKCLFNILAVLTAYNVQDRLNNASNVLYQIGILYSHRKKTAAIYLISTIAYVAVLLGAILPLIIKFI